MDFKGIELVCPICREDLQYVTEAQLSCENCDRRFPILLGIPDLRVHADPYIDLEGDRAKGLELAGRCAGLDFDGAVDLYYQLAAQVPQKQARLFKRGLAGAVPRLESALTAWELRAGQPEPAESLLEIGCGTAPLLAVAAGRYQRLVGIDIAFRWLVIAQKRLAEAHLDLPLIAACAEALPFSNGSFDRVVGDSVFEHLLPLEQSKAMAECRRVLRPRGYLFAATPNRFSLGPDPHTGLWLGSYWPRRLVNGYVRRQGGNPPHRHLLSHWSLRKLITGAGFAEPAIYAPDIPSGQRASLSARLNHLLGLYEAVRRAPGGEWLLTRIGPLLHATASLPEAKE